MSDRAQSGGGVQTIRQRQAIHRGARLYAEVRDARDNVVHMVRAAPPTPPAAPPPKPHFEDTVAGMVITIFAAFMVLGVVGIRFLHIALGGQP